MKFGRPVMPEATSVDKTQAARRGRDAQLPGWLREGTHPESANFDSVVIRGGGVTALVFGARLARSQDFRDRVVFAASPAVETPKLINGCTLRARSVDYFSAALGCSYGRVVDAIFGERTQQAAAYSQYFSLFERSSMGNYRAVKARKFMSARGDGKPFAYGVRNGRLAAALSELLDSHRVRWSEPDADSLDACRLLAPGTRPLIVNGGYLPLLGAPKTSPPTCSVVAYQCTMRRRKECWLPEGASLIAAIQHPTCNDVGVFYPFADPLTPDADVYGLFYRIVRPGPEFVKEEAIAEMREEVLAVGRAVGLEPVAEGSTGAGALVPGFSWRDVESELPDYLDLHRIMNAGIPVISGCGMARAGLAGWVAAELVLSGRDVGQDLNRSLSRWRSLNQMFYSGMDRHPGVFAQLMRYAPAQSMRFLADRPDMWASASS